MSKKQKTKKKLPSIPEVKRTIMENWKLRVKQRDGWACVLCGAKDYLNAHHWYASDHSGHMSRYCIDNGVTLCYACHLRKVHIRADYRTINELFTHMLENGKADPKLIDSLIDTPVTVPELRALWKTFRSDVVDCQDDFYILKKGKKIFLLQNTDIENQSFVKNQIVVFEELYYDVVVVSKLPTGQYRYTLKEMEKEDE